MSDDQIIAQASRLHVSCPDLRPLDWRVLGAIIDAGATGLPLAYVRTRTDFLGSLPAFLPAADRLIRAGLVERREVPYQATDYSGKAGRKPRAEVVYYRTGRAIAPFAPSNFSL
jgi:hypothetical protein